MGLALLALAPAGASAGTLADYERVSERVWGHAPPVVYTWAHSDAEMARYCDPARTLPAGRIAACSDLGGPGMFLSWTEWLAMDRLTRCRLHAHEWGHLLGWTHGDALFNAMERRARRLCQRRFVRRGWFVSRLRAVPSPSI